MWHVGAPSVGEGGIFFPRLLSTPFFHLHLKHPSSTSIPTDPTIFPNQQKQNKNLVHKDFAEHVPRVHVNTGLSLYLLDCGPNSSNEIVEDFFLLKFDVTLICKFYDWLRKVKCDFTKQNGI